MTARLFAALGDTTRLALVAKLSTGAPRSISHLAVGSRLTRQAITKHLLVLERAGLIRGARRGRERRFQLDPEPLDELRGYLEFVSEQWDRALSRLKDFIED